MTIGLTTGFGIFALVVAVILLIVYAAMKNKNKILLVIAILIAILAIILIFIGVKESKDDTMKESFMDKYKQDRFSQGLNEYPWTNFEMNTLGSDQSLSPTRDL